MVNGGLSYYTYDAQNQLLEARSGGKTYTYTYDAAGNIQTASDGTTTHNYTYDTGVWKDLLKYFDGEEIVYDASGNPTTYYNGTEWNMTWAEGRRLVTAKKADNSLEVTYTYDSDGLRLSKTVNDSTTYSYHYAGGKLLRQTDGTNTLDFFYDASGNPYALKYNNTLYYYITNLQGDVLHIVDTSGAPVVSYTYDPYGKLLSSTNSTLGNLNPLRYRGYVYDTETGLYYLQSRYYDPEIGRFINADSYASTGQGVLGCNMFAYCNNSPAIFVDPHGMDAAVLYDDDTVGHIGIIVQDEEGNWWHFYWGTKGGFWGTILRVLAFLGSDVKSYTWCVPYEGEVSLEKINESKQFGGDYEQWQYMTGDFSECVEMLKNIDDQYNLYSRNCSQVSLRILAYADTAYSQILFDASHLLLPGRAFSYIEKREFDAVSYAD